MPKLTARQALFVAEYLKDLNATQAAIRAGYSVRTARFMASELLSKPHIAAEVERLKSEQLHRVTVEADDILREIKLYAHSDPIHLVTEQGAVKNLRDIPEAMRRCIASFEIEEIWGPDGEGGKLQIGVLKKLKLWDKPKGLQQLGEHKALFTQKHELTGAGGAPLQVTINIRRTVAKE